MRRAFVEDITRADDRDQAIAQSGRHKPASSPQLEEALGEDFVRVLIAVKEAEHEACQSVISSWEREHLLLNV